MPMPPFDALSDEQTVPAIKGTSSAGDGAILGDGKNNGVVGLSNANEHSGVFGHNKQGGAGVAGRSRSGDGVQGTSEIGTGVVGHGFTNGVVGISLHGGAEHSGVFGKHEGGGTGVSGEGAVGVRGVGRTGVVGETFADGPGVRGFGSTGVIGEGVENGVAGICKIPDHSGVFGSHTGAGFGVTGESHGPEGAGIHGRGFNGAAAGRFSGDVDVEGNIHCRDMSLTGGDCAEEFSIADGQTAEPGTVMIITDHEHGKLSSLR